MIYLRCKHGLAALPQAANFNSTSNAIGGVKYTDTQYWSFSLFYNYYCLKSVLHPFKLRKDRLIYLALIFEFRPLRAKVR